MDGAKPVLKQLLGTYGGGLRRGHTLLVKGHIVILMLDTDGGAKPCPPFTQIQVY